GEEVVATGHACVRDTLRKRAARSRVLRLLPPERGHAPFGIMTAPWREREWCPWNRKAQAFLRVPQRPGYVKRRSVAFRPRATLRELRERLRDRRLVRQDVEHTAALERRADDLLVELGRDVDAAVSDAVVVRRRRCKALDAPPGRDAGWRMETEESNSTRSTGPASIDGPKPPTMRPAGVVRSRPGISRSASPAMPGAE